MAEGSTFSRRFERMKKAISGEEAATNRRRIVNAAIDTKEGIMQWVEQRPPQSIVRRTTEGLLELVGHAWAEDPIEVRGEQSDIILRKILPFEKQQSLRILFEKFSGKIGARLQVGEKERTHAHDFILERTQHGFLFYFLDSEESVGKNNVLAPRIVQLVALELPSDPTHKPQVAIGRFDTSKLSVEAKRPFIKLDQLRQKADEFLKTGVLQGMPDEQIYFLLHITDDGVRLVDRHVRNVQILQESIDNPAAPISANTAGKAFLAEHWIGIFEKLLNNGHIYEVKDDGKLTVIIPGKTKRPVVSEPTKNQLVA